MITTLYRLNADGTENCFYIETAGGLCKEHYKMLHSIISESHAPRTTGRETFLSEGNVVEIGPRLTVETPFSSNAVAIMTAIQIKHIRRIEYSTRYPIATHLDATQVLKKHLDFMTQEVYPKPLGQDAFVPKQKPESVRIIPILERGEIALRELNRELGLGMDDWDIKHWSDYFIGLKRNPTDVELFDIGQGNSNHSRHWFFKGRIIIDSLVMPWSLMDLIKEPLKRLGAVHNKVLAFNDNAGAIKGHTTHVLVPVVPGEPSVYVRRIRNLLITATAETHNHPTMWEPFNGAATGVGGMLRDKHAPGRGAYSGASVAGYAVGNLHIPGHIIPGEVTGGNETLEFAAPLQIYIRGSDGVSSYGNQFGDPVIAGYARAFGLEVFGERRETLKPVLYCGGVGRLYAEHAHKRAPEKGMLIIRIGGPAFRIGVGGGGASSTAAGANSRENNLKSVQRGNGEEENKGYHAIRTFIEMDDNLVEAIHDQGAGGPSNELKELMEPAGGYVDISKIKCGDASLSILEKWCAEYQEGYGFLVRSENLEKVRAVCARERVNCEVLGEVTGDGYARVIDSTDGSTPVCLNLADVLGKLPQKTYRFVTPLRRFEPLKLPDNLSVSDALERVFKQVAVGSKKNLTNKVDRSVTGLVAQQQCCGPAQIPVADVAVTADSYSESANGAAFAIGEQQNMFLLDPRKAARMVAGELLTNICSAGLSDIREMSLRVNSMWPAMLMDEGAFYYSAIQALSDILCELGLAPDGGKDSTSLSAEVAGRQVKSPGQLVLLGYAPILDVKKVVTPDFKECDEETLIGYIDLGFGKYRLGGSALAQSCGQIGSDCPDMDDPQAVLASVRALSELIHNGYILALHDRSGGGLVTTLAEMCLSGLQGAEVNLPTQTDLIHVLFAEERGWLFQYRTAHSRIIADVFERHHVMAESIGVVRLQSHGMAIRHGIHYQNFGLALLRQRWEATSDAIEALQANPTVVQAEKAMHATHIDAPRYQLSFVPTPTQTQGTTERHDVNPRVAILREEGTNGEREMAAAFHEGGCEAIDINMQDLLDEKATLDDCQGLVFPGGFSYMDVFRSAAGWAAVIKYNSRIKEMFERFYARTDTFSLGVCNGCQLGALLGLVPFKDIDPALQPRFVHNDSGRFESRWVNVAIRKSPSILFQGMEGSVLGIWLAHGEGRAFFPDPDVLARVMSQELIPLVYADPNGLGTEAYPYNPNGSIKGIAALCTPDGRHTIMMPHFERCFLTWQWAYMSQKWKRTLTASPWLRVTQNAREWCLEHRLVAA